jgi:hypothetical protein
VLEDVPAVSERPPPKVAAANVLTLSGFGLVLALSVLPWSRFGDASGQFEAWRVHWSLLAAAAGGAGFVASIAFWRRPRDLRVEAAVCLSLALLVILGAYMHRLHPPSLSSASTVPLLAIGAALAAVAGAGLEIAALVRAR